MENSAANIVDAIGNTPLVEIRRLNPNPRVKVFAKIESFNPGGSIKDRVALAMIAGAERRGELTKDRIILEATSGNTGIGLALIAAAKGYRLCLAMPESASEERKKILKALGAELYLTPANLGTDGAIEVAYNLLREQPGKYFGTDQYNNPDNIEAHYVGTGEEIWRQTKGAVTMAVVTLGTTGTAMGISRRLKEYNPEVKIVGVEPYLQHKIQGLKNLKESYQPGIFDRSRLDDKVNIHDEDAFEMARRLVREEGIFAGMSSGAAMHVAIEKAKVLESGVIVAVLPDGGERYLSTALFSDRQETSLLFYNTMTRQKEPFRPINPDEIRMYACGPTVHEAPHIGSYRRFVLSDLLRRYLAYRGYKIRLVTNIIDLADRSIRGAERAGTDLASYTERHASAFLAGIEKLNIAKEEHYPRASEKIDVMLSTVEKLVQRGYAYEKLRSVYFDVSKLEEYGKLSNIDPRQMGRSKTVEMDDYAKDSPVDFALLKRSTLSELKRGVYFKTRWGNVRPSWHLECAAIALDSLGDQFDIHLSGADIVFPHCENVLAVGKAATGKKIANYWLNAELVMVGAKKMSRSLNNAVTLAELEEKGFCGKEIRFFLLGIHYRKPLSFSVGALETARNTVRKLNGFVQRLMRMRPGEGYPDVDQYIYDVRQEFASALDDDLNVSGALAALFRFVKRIGPPLSKGLLSAAERDAVLETLQKIDSVLGVTRFEEEKIPAEAERLIAERESMRSAGKWREADAIRGKLSDLGVDVRDFPEGTVWTYKQETDL